MGFTNKYPYTDMHELNLDWFLKQFADYTSEFDQFAEDMTNAWNEYKNTLDGEWHDVEEAWTTLYNYVHDYFDNLDVQDEVDAKLDAMASDGTLTNLMEPYFSDLSDDVSALQTDVSALQTAVTPQNETATENENITVTRGDFYKCGKILNCNFNIYVDTALAATDVLFTLPVEVTALNQQDFVLPSMFGNESMKALIRLLMK